MTPLCKPGQAEHSSQQQYWEGKGKDPRSSNKQKTNQNTPPTLQKQRLDEKLGDDGDRCDGDEAIPSPSDVWLGR